MTVRQSRRHGKVASNSAVQSASPPPDCRRQLVNDGLIGPIDQVALPEDQITSLSGIMLDLDPDLFRREVVQPHVARNPKAFYEQVVAPWLARHPILNAAEVLNSGRGLHINILFNEPAVFETDGDRKRWAGMIKAIQAVLPTDPRCPGITAMTRAVGSVNSKTGTKVRVLRAGQPVPVAVVVDLYEQLRAKPFRTVSSVLFGDGRITPCSVCKDEDSMLTPLDFFGQCYGPCGKVKLSQLYEVFLVPRK